MLFQHALHSFVKFDLMEFSHAIEIPLSNSNAGRADVEPTMLPVQQWQSRNIQKSKVYEQGLTPGCEDDVAIDWCEGEPENGRGKLNEASLMTIWQQSCCCSNFMN